MTARAKKTQKPINLALQGGGSHGAYTWGVLDRLLEEESLLIEGISGTSAGAMNAAVLISGYMNGGNQGAKDALEQFWRHISEAAVFSPLHKNPAERLATGWNMDFSPMYRWLDMMSRLFSPYEINPMGFNPMRPIIEHMLDMDALRACDKIKLFITATHVASGQARVFHREEITADVLLASACIPFIFQAVEIEGEHYWDGGYMGNPAIWPLIYNCQSEDVVLVQINPIHNEQLPRSAGDIINRLNEITFNSSLIAEMRAIEFVSKLLKDGRLEHGRYKDMRMHLIYSPEDMKHLNASSKMNADWDFFLFLKQKGRDTADKWLRYQLDDVGLRSTVDIRKKFLRGPGAQPAHGSLGERVERAAPKKTAPLKQRPKNNQKQQTKKRK